MIKISELKEGDTLSSSLNNHFTILKHLGNCVLLESEDGVDIYTERTLNKYGFARLVATPEKKYFMGFEVREYPERPIVEVGDVEFESCFLRLVEVKEEGVVCTNSNNNFTVWKLVYRIPETKIVEPTSSGTREGDGC